jgi:hypothetical protein
MQGRLETVSMVMQPTEVLDTAVKIGLGAIVGGIFAYLLERLKQRNERIKERLQLRQERIIDPKTIERGLLPYRQLFERAGDFELVSRYGTSLILSPNKTLGSKK